MAYIQCPDCGKAYVSQDEVALDVINTIIHKECPDKRNHLNIIDEGTFEEIVKRYPFFDESRLA
ncbi:hypothetical protein [Rossellomorea marisflavi]|uniref:hypothetical protein n=1 Tax=Rossellomorea marisflavi TaxID=189381 RepID=UPI0011E7430E|nr:hypothetical protein [Rossellomorea marisflavi]TYO69964.1 hypothetical protein DQ398_003251 [Rossellomorea marisflavi]